MTKILPVVSSLFYAFELWLSTIFRNKIPSKAQTKYTVSVVKFGKWKYDTLSVSIFVQENELQHQNILTVH